MAQGKLKVKTKVPDNIKKKKANSNKGAGINKRSNRPIQPKKTKFEDQFKIKQAITKMVNKSVEEEIRAAAGCKDKSLSKAQQAVAQHNTKS